MDFNTQYIDIQMSVLECTICGEKSFMLIREQKEVARASCGWCGSTFHSIMNYDQCELNIENIKKEMI